MQFSQLPALGRVGRQPLLHGSLQLFLNAFCQAGHGLILRLRQAGKFIVGFLNRLLAVARANLRAVVGLVFRQQALLKALEFFLVAHGFAPFLMGNGFLYRQDEGAQSFAAALQLGQMPPQGGAGVKARVLEYAGNFLQRQAQLTVKENLLQGVHLGGAVDPVARVGDPAGGQQPDFVIIPERAGGNPRQPGKLPYGVFHPCSPPDKPEYKL
ncbi:hypothetical protein SDC9_178088 [bioreactor metagenome]|uniref:Uncharacterized protein n=1 Tax=bioreactor metagenome TaxID=1076179 RepID=A0A645GV42_9ZZZZ